MSLIERLIKETSCIKDLKQKQPTKIIKDEIISLEKSIDYIVNKYKDISNLKDFFIEKYSKTKPENVRKTTESSLPILNTTFTKDGITGVVVGNYVKVQLLKKDGTLSKQFQYIKLGE